MHVALDMTDEPLGVVSWSKGRRSDRSDDFSFHRMKFTRHVTAFQIAAGGKS